MNHRLLRVVLLTALGWAVVATVPKIRAAHFPGNHQGFEPTQPIAFSHRLHAGELAMPCLYCHFGAERSRYAGIPPASVCMNCHRFVTASRGALRAEEQLAVQDKRAPRPIVSPELRKLYDALALDDQTLKPDSTRTPHPISWVRIHRLPDFVAFDHRPHVRAGVDCRKCHGPVESMERIRHDVALDMGFCVNCHRQARIAGIQGRPVQPSLDCGSCHY